MHQLLPLGHIPLYCDLKNNKKGRPIFSHRPISYLGIPTANTTSMKWGFFFFFFGGHSKIPGRTEVRELTCSHLHKRSQQYISMDSFIRLVNCHWKRKTQRLQRWRQVQLGDAGGEVGRSLSRRDNLDSSQARDPRVVMERRMLRRVRTWKGCGQPQIQSLSGCSEYD